MIVLDLEWSQPYGGGMEEILQIGAVRLDHLGAPLSGRFNVLHKTGHTEKAVAHRPEAAGRQAVHDGGCPLCGGV